MRRLLFGAICFAAGLFALPLFIVCAKIAFARQASLEISKSVDGPEALDVSRLPQMQTIAEVAVSSVALPAKIPERGMAPLPECSVDQLAEGPTDFQIGDDKPFDRVRSPNEAQMAPGLPGNAPQSTVPRLVLPATSGMLAVQAPIEEAEAAKLAELRETLKKTVESKAALLNADALQAEIAMHQRHESELRALLELERLQKSLEELSDKYPESDAGRRAKQVLQMLKMRGAVPVYVPVPVDDEPFSSAPPYNPSVAPTFNGSPNNAVPSRVAPTPSVAPPTRDQPIKPKLPTY